MSQIVKLKLNGVETSLIADGDETLLDLLRGKAGITSLKCGCNHGDCGACTIHLDGKAVKACTILAAATEGHSVDTLESLYISGELHPLQQSFIDFNAPQCGYCAPGMLMAASAFLNKTPHPTEEEVREAIGGNLCRCTGYKLYVDAIMAVVNSEALCLSYKARE